MADCGYPTRFERLKSTLLPDGYLVITDEPEQVAITLNPMGAVIWEYCDGDHTLDDIAGELAELGAGPKDQLMQVVTDLVHELAESGFLEISPSK